MKACLISCILIALVAHRAAGEGLRAPAINGPRALGLLKKATTAITTATSNTTGTVSNTAGALSSTANVVANATATANTVANITTTLNSTTTVLANTTASVNTTNGITVQLSAQVQICLNACAAAWVPGAAAEACAAMCHQTGGDLTASLSNGGLATDAGATSTTQAQAQAQAEAMGNGAQAEAQASANATADAAATASKDGVTAKVSAQIEVCIDACARAWAAGTIELQACIDMCNQSKGMEGPPSFAAGSASGFGDPHLKTWHDHHFDYHGECDLVLLSNPHFDNGAGMDIHIRTEIRKDYSFIANAAVRIGTDILEVASQGVYYVNGALATSMPAHMAGKYKITSELTAKQRLSIAIHLGGRSRIVIREYHDFVSVSIMEGRYEHFGRSVGLMGRFTDGSMLARDGTTLMTHPNEFGQEWQVRPSSSDQMLFASVRAPQFPMQCRLPAAQVAELRQRHLRGGGGGDDIGNDDEPHRLSRAQAEAACAKWNANERRLCVDDVLSTNDIAIADAVAV